MCYSLRRRTVTRGREGGGPHPPGPYLLDLLNTGRAMVERRATPRYGVCYSSRQRRVPWSAEGPAGLVCVWYSSEAHANGVPGSPEGPTPVLLTVCVFLKLIGPSPGPQGVGLPTRDTGAAQVAPHRTDSRQKRIVPPHYSHLYPHFFPSQHVLSPRQSLTHYQTLLGVGASAPRCAEYAVPTWRHGDMATWGA